MVSLSDRGCLFSINLNLRTRTPVCRSNAMKCTQKVYILVTLIFLSVLLMNTWLGGFDKLFDLECTNFDVLTESQFCHNGKLITLDQLTEPQVHQLYQSILFGTPKPPPAQRTFATATTGTKLEIVLIELKAAPVHALIPTIYNIGHVHGGNNTAFTVLYHDFHHAGIESTINEWPTVRWIKMSGELTIPDYNRMLTSFNFWDQFKSEFILITHTDSMIFRQVDEEFYNFEYVGSPWLDPNICGPSRPAVGNGGYSLRNVSWHKHIVSTTQYTDGSPEDVWWCSRVERFVPDRDFAMKFGVEQAWYNGTPSGSHRLEWMRGCFNRAGNYFRKYLENNYRTYGNSSKDE